ncbi:hypothetical protein O0S10_02695 [Methanocorpusculum sp. MG]|uniref:Lipoprotein n=1 Tax=Methanocorpusculum petauri TaxID=3002863 RepID=A0ABT4IEH4_9EURY|nr:hypothetical protein [Methanocorpusculum petauri]MCZ0860138.1 hypothetical protein [Methanocorpusculum petauri]MDE2444401.1 hypothetical protein [Methanocorpusculum sp.]
MQLTKFAAVVLIVAAVCLAVTAGCAVAAPADVPQPSVAPHYHAYLSCPYYDAGQCPGDCGWNQPRYAESHYRHHGRC